MEAVAGLEETPARRDDGRVERLVAGGAVVEYELAGGGEDSGGEGGGVVLLVHARPFVRWYEPLCAALAGRTVLRTRRTVPREGSWSVEDDADLYEQLLTAAGVDRPHVVGHSYGGLVALELARRGVVAPRSLALLEPATSGLYPPDEAAVGLAPLLALAEAEGAEVAMTRFLGTVCGDGAADELERLVPGAVADALAHAPGFMSVELPAVARWSFTAGDAASLDVPLLNVRGTDSAARFQQGADILAGWFPAAASFTLAGANHLLVAQDPLAMAAGLEEFWRTT